MRNYRILIMGLFLLPIVAMAQTDVAKVINEANALYAKKDIRHSLMMFRKLHAQVSPADTLYPAVAKGLFESLLYSANDSKERYDYEGLLDLSDEAIQVLEGDKKYLPADFQPNKYLLYENIIIAYAGMGKYVPAKAYQIQLYDAYEKKQLPEAVYSHYNFERFVQAKMNVSGNEWYTHDSTAGKDALIKSAYQVYARDTTSGKNGKWLYDMVLVRNGNKDGFDTYVFAKRTMDKKKVVLQTSSTSTYSDPVSLEKLHKAAMECLKGEMKFDEEEGKK